MSPVVQAQNWVAPGVHATTWVAVEQPPVEAPTAKKKASGVSVAM
jgi:hypothetical protein